jgi:hypothetical protein
MTTGKRSGADKKAKRSRRLGLNKKTSRALGVTGTGPRGGAGMLAGNAVANKLLNNNANCGTSQNSNP